LPREKIKAVEERKREKGKSLRIEERVAAS